MMCKLQINFKQISDPDPDFQIFWEQGAGSHKNTKS